jgi:WhiB family transcriptional regulator, redox-sensing transcriptional regulator
VRQIVWLGPLQEAWDWQDHAQCRGADSTIFFHTEGEQGRAHLDRVERAKEMCRGCAVVAQCRDHALATREPYGIWGGLTESERRQWQAAL